MEKYKCPKCGNEKEFIVWSWCNVKQLFDQEKDEWSEHLKFGDSYVDHVKCAECGTVVVEQTYELVEPSAETIQQRKRG